MNIFILASNNYPSASEPQKGTFVYKLIQEFSKNHRVHVFAPEKRFIRRNKQIQNYGNDKAIVVRPKFTTFSNRNIFGFNTYHIGRMSMIKTLRKVYKSIEKVDFVYAHFLSNALIGVEALKNFDVPIFVAVGEYKNIEIVKAYYSDSKYSELVHQIKGFVAVSPMVKEKIIRLNIANGENSIIAPNGVDRKVFKPLNEKLLLRKELNLPLEKKIILFVGRFQHDKGPKRVVKALEMLNNSQFTLILLGVGSQELVSKFIHFQGAVKNEDVAKYMAAADVFALPTLHEGSSNVIVEAMASGLPIISSNIPEIRFQCTSQFSILVDPLNISDIANAINYILSDEIIQQKMSLAAREYSKLFDIKQRAEKILHFITTHLNKANT